MSSRWRLLILFILPFAVMAAAAQSTRNGYPQYTDVYVNDFASVLSPTMETSIRELLTDLRNDGKQAVVVTIDSYTDYNTGDDTFESFVTNLFNTWGVGDSDSDGAMILVAIRDRKVRIEVGSAYENTMNKSAQGIIDEFMLPKFRQNRYEEGIYDGVRGLVASLTGVFPESSAPVVSVTLDPQRFENPAIASSRSTTSTSSGSSSTGTVVAAGAAGATALGGLAVGVRRYMRFRPRNCAKCGSPMTRLGEVEDDEFLDEGQRTEESMGAVDYDVWKCSSCGSHQLFNYTGLTFHRNCPSCNYRTVTTNSRVLYSATYDSTGLREVTHTCHHCDYNRVFEETIPRKVRSSSSSGGGSSRSSRGSFGGGKSSGGGASGSW